MLVTTQTLMEKLRIEETTLRALNQNQLPTSGTLTEVSEQTIESLDYRKIGERCYCAKACMYCQHPVVTRRIMTNAPPLVSNGPQAHLQLFIDFPANPS